MKCKWIQGTGHLRFIVKDFVKAVVSTSKENGVFKIVIFGKVIVPPDNVYIRIVENAYLLSVQDAVNYVQNNKKTYIV